MKSFFTKLGTLLLCGVAVAVVGCTDFSEDIQAGDKALQDKIESVEKSTASTIAELKAAIKTLEETQAQMASDYAKKTDLETVKNDLQTALNAKIEAVAADVTSANAKIAALESGKADKSALEALAGDVDAAIKKAEDAIKALEAAKADKTQVDKIEGDVATLIEGYQQMIYQFQNLQLVVEGKADQADLDVVEGDVETLKQGYMETVLALTEIKAALETKASQTDLELTKKDVETLKEASAQAVFAITNLQTAVEVLDERVDALEEGLNAAKEQIAQHTEALQNIKQNLMTVEGDLEAEAELREKADEALQTYVDQLNYGLTNLKVAYDVHIEEYEAYKETLKKNLDDLAAADGALATSLLSYYNQAITAVEESEAKLDSLINDEINKALNVVAQQRTEIEGMIAHTEESISKAFAEADQEVITYVKDTLLTVVYNTIYDNHKTYEARFESVEAAVAAMDEEFRTVLSALQQADVNLNAYCDDLQAQLEAQKDEYTSLINSLQESCSNLDRMIAELENKFSVLISSLTERVEKLEVDVEGLKKSLAALEKALQEAAQKCADRDAQMAQTIQGLKDLCADYLNMIGANKDELYKHSQEIAKLWTEINDIAEYTGELNTTIQQLNNDMLEKFGLVDSALTELETAYKAADDEIKEQIENGLAEVIAAAAKGDADLDAKINDLFNLIVSDLNGRIQSVVFVPGHSDLKASGTVYTYADNKEQVIVRATYQVTPANHVAKIGTELEVIGALQAVETRAAADEYLFAEAAYITDVNLNNGKFDVEYVFDAEDFDALVSNEGKRPQEDQDYMTRCVLGTFVQHPECVMPAEDVDDEMGIATETLFKNYKVSDFAAVNVDRIDLNDRYVLTKETEKGYVDYTTINDKVAWSTATPDRKPFENYDVMIRDLEGLDEYATLEEVADYLRLYDAEGKPNKAIITPAYKYENKYYWADPQTDAFKAEPLTAAYTDEETTCTGVHEVTGTDLYKTFSIAIKNPKNENAEDLIGHKLAHHVDFYFGPAAAPTAIVIVADYNYIIDYRTYVYNLVGGAAQHRIDWTYDLANALADKVDPKDEKTWKANAKEMHGDETRKTDPYFVENFTEYDIIPAETNEGEPVDYKATIKNFPAVRTVKANVANVKLPVLEIMPRTGIIHDIAAVKIVENYEFIDKDVLYNFTNTHTDDQVTYTKVQFNYDLTLGHMPLEVAVTTPVETINYKAKDWTKTIDFSALTAQAPELAGHGFGTAYNPTTDDTNLGESALYASETPARLIDKKGSSIAIQSGKVTVTPEAQQDIFNNEAAKSSGYLTRTVTTWYGTKFIYKVPFTVVAPAYKLDINPLHVAEGADGYFATANYVYANDNNRTYTIVNSFMQDYFRVLNFDKENDLTVNFQIISKDANDKSTPRFLDPATREAKWTTRTKPVVNGGTFERNESELSWNDYHFTSVDVKAQLRVNGVAFGDPVTVTILAQDPLELRGAEIVKNWVANEDLPIEDVLAGAQVSIIDQAETYDAARFETSNSKYYYRWAKAYDAKFTVEKVKVYFFENDGETKTDVPAQYYSYYPQTRKLVFKKETADLMTAIFAEFDVTMDYTLDCDEPETVKVVYKVPAVEK